VRQSFHCRRNSAKISLGVFALGHASHLSPVYNLAPRWCAALLRKMSGENRPGAMSSACSAAPRTGASAGRFRPSTASPAARDSTASRADGAEEDVGVDKAWRVHEPRLCTSSRSRRSAARKVPMHYARSSRFSRSALLRCQPARPGRRPPFSSMNGFL
jgi:hypothetical protein